MMEPTYGLSPAAARGLESKTEKGATAKALGGAAAAYLQEAKTGRSFRRLWRRHRTEYLHKMWTMDFQFDATADGRKLIIMNVINE